jgi:DNA-binding XRE family transcriptional regulator
MTGLPKPLRMTDAEVTLSSTAWAAIVAMAEDLDDLTAVAQARNESAIPVEVVEAKLDGAHPLAAWRQYRGLSQQELAGAARVSRGMVGKIETRAKVGAARTYKRLAAALGVPIECIYERREAP